MILGGLSSCLSASMPLCQSVYVSSLASPSINSIAVSTTAIKKAADVKDVTINISSDDGS